MAEPVRVGFIGCGGNARHHIRRLLEVEGAQVVGVFDVVPQNAEEAAVMAGAQTYPSHHALLERSDLDCMYISIPVFAHGEIELAVIERDLPFLVEKPVALDLSTALAIQSAIRKKKLMTAVGYQLRYAATADVALERLKGQRLGLITGRYWSGSGKGDPERWLCQMAKSGGQLVEQATHTIDMMRFLGGEIQEVFCYQGRQVLTDIDCPDANAVALRFANGAVGTLTAVWAYEQDKKNTNVLDVFYEAHRLTWSYGKLTVMEGPEPQEFTQPGPTIDSVFIQAVRERRPALIRSSYADAVRTLAASLAMNESATTGRPVVLKH